jgi:urea-proton symporter
MDKSVLALTNGLSPGLGFTIMVGLGVFLLALSFAIKTTLVRNTHDFIIADRKVGFGFGVGLVIAVWTWAMAVMMSSAICYSTIDGASAALSSVVAVDIVKRYWPATKEGPLFVITKLSMLLGGLVATLIVLSGVDFTTLVLTTYALKTSILLPLVLAILWPRTNTVGFVGGVALAILIGMPIYETQGELIGTLSIVAISGITVVIAGYAGSARFDIASLRRVGDDIASEAPAAIAQPAE